MKLTPISQTNAQLSRHTVDRRIEQLANAYATAYGIELYNGDDPKIKLNYLTSKMALLYEKVRYTVDYKDEHLLRRSAIERIVKRILLISRKDPSSIAHTLLHELVRAQYLPNDAIPERMITSIARVIDKYLKLHDALSLRYDRSAHKELHNFVWSIMAAEIEEVILPPIREDALVETVYQVTKPRINIMNYSLRVKELEIQLYLALHRNLIKSDETLLRYYLFKLYLPDWEIGRDATITLAADNFQHIIKGIDYQLKHPLADLMMRKLKPICVYFTMLSDVLAHNRSHLSKTLSYPSILKKEIKDACDKRYQRAQSKLKRGGVRSVLYIFFTKIILALAIEIPYDRIFLGSIHYLPLAANALFHPLLMALILGTTRVPGEKNTEKIIEGITDIVTGKPVPQITIKFKRSAQLGSSTWVVINLFYLFMYILTFGVIVSILTGLNFSILSSMMFVVFLTLISFFGIRLRLNAREYHILNKRENIITFLFDLFTIPIIRVGRWISLNSRRINIFVFVLDFIIEAPYKFIVAAFEDITSFVKEKKEEVS